MSTAATLGRYRDDLVGAGFTHEEALDLVGQVAPMDTADLDTSRPAPKGVGSNPLRIVVLAGNREEAERWRNDQFVRNTIDTPDRIILAADHPDSLLGLPGPLAVVTLPGFYRLPADERAEIEYAIRRANAKV